MPQNLSGQDTRLPATHRILTGRLRNPFGSTIPVPTEEVLAHDAEMDRLVRRANPQVDLGEHFDGAA